MITGWKEFTYELTEFESHTLLPIVIEAWEKKKIGELVNMSSMIKGMNDYLAKHNILVGKKKKKLAKVSGPRMRKLIHQIRVKGIFPNLVANSKGYFLTDNKEEILAFIKSCEERASSFDEVATSMRRHNNLYNINHSK